MIVGISKSRKFNIPNYIENIYSDNIVNGFRFSVHINKTNSHTFCDQGCQVILDTSTNRIGVPNQYLITINTLIKATKYLYNRYQVTIIKCLIFNLYHLIVAFHLRSTIPFSIRRH